MSLGDLGGFQKILHNIWGGSGENLTSAYRVDWWVKKGTKICLRNIHMNGPL